MTTARVCAVLRQADRCSRCGHRRDSHVRDGAECCHIPSGGGAACACKKFSAARGRSKAVP